MNLKLRITLVILIMFGLMLLGQWQVFKLLITQNDERFERTVATSQDLLTATYLQRVSATMRGHLRDVTRNSAAIQAIVNDAPEQLRTVLEPAYQRLVKSDVLSELLIVDEWGQILLREPANQDQQSYLIEPIIEQVVAENTMKFGLLRTYDGLLRSAFAFPLYQQREMIGVVLMLHDLTDMAQNLADSLNSDVFIQNFDHSLDVGTNIPLWHTMAQHIHWEKDIQQLPLNRSMYQLHNSELHNLDGNPIAQVVIATDISAELVARERLNHQILAMIAGFMAFTLLLLYAFLDVSFRPLRLAIDSVKRAAAGEGDARISLAQLAGAAGEVTELAATIHAFQIKQEKARAAAEAASRAKSQFLANMSHEIRTPLNAIIGIAKIMQDTHTLSADNKQHCSTIVSAGDNLLHIINDVLDLAKIEAGQMTLRQQPVHLTHLLADVARLFHPQAVSKHLKLELNLDPQFPTWVVGDAVRIRQIFVNLVGNALKFTEQGRITIHGRVASQLQQNVVVECAIEDTGIGIPADKLRSVFEKFTQVDNSNSRTYQGTGLGLAIAEDFTKLMGGRIWVTSTVGTGTTFHFTLQFPLTTAPDAPATKPDTLEKLRENTHILVVEDNPSNQLVAKHFLKDFAIHIDIANNGQEAVTAVTNATTPYQVIFMDCQMPVMDGYAATAAIRALELQNKCPRQTIIALTANAMPEDEQRCLIAGMDGFITKPVTKENLREIILKHR